MRGEIRNQNRIPPGLRPYLVQPAAVEQGGQLVHVDLGGVQEPLDPQEVSLRNERARTVIDTSARGDGPPERPLTRAVGKKGVENCSKPWTWICMVVRERWQTVSDCGDIIARHKQRVDRIRRLFVWRQHVRKSNLVLNKAL